MPTATQQAELARLARHPLADTPWGERAQIIREIAPGITHVETASHGGIHLSPEMNAQVPEAWRVASFNKQAVRGWYEEDCDWSMVALTFPRFFEGHCENAQSTFDHWVKLKLEHA